MRKAGAVIGLICSLGFCFTAAAAPVGNPGKPVLEIGDSRIEVGIVADMVFERDLDISDAPGEVNRIRWSGVKLSYNFEDVAETSVTRAAADLKFTERHVQYKTETGFGLGVGQSLTMYEFENGLQVGLDGQFRVIDADVDQFYLGGTRYLPTSSGVSGVDVEYAEWQVAVGLSKELEHFFELEYFLPYDWIFVPYAGIKYSDVNVTGKATVSSVSYDNEDINSDEKFGVFVGVDLLAAEDLSIGVEGRFIDEQAVSFSINYRF